jgi:class 3 adenylate cyclase/tetratricopeptide (TPR) repeat protein
VASVAPESDEGERRPVTVLFADLTDYTRMSQRLDPEDVHALLGRFYEAVDEIVERFGGSIDKHIGDSVMAVFGAPIAHGDEAERAVRAAAEIQRVMPSLGERDTPLAVHIGIAAGEVVASGLGSTRHRAYTVIGNSVNLASRLLKLAAANETVLDDAVHAAVDRIARCTAISGAAIKGIDAPLTAWRFAELVQPDSSNGARPFVGRHAELAQLSAILQSCAHGSAGGTVFVRGDAGIGKSRLVGELRRLALAEGFLCHSGLVLDFGIAKGRDAIRDIVASAMQLAAGADTDARDAALKDLAARHPRLAARLPFLCDLLDLSQPTEGAAHYDAMDNAARQRGRAAALVELLDATRGKAPVLAIVEDVHWADKVTLDYLAALTRSAATVPIVLAMTSRVEGDPLDPGWRGSVQGSPLITIDLGPLGAEDALAFAEGFLSAPRGFAQKCVERAGGNPLYLEQLMRATDERGDRLPASLHSLVLSRMDRLPERDRAALRAAAVVGQRFPLDLVRRLAQLPDYECDRLIASFLVRPEGDDYLFAHALIRDGVYTSLTRARRAELHRVAADWYGTRDLALRAEHLDRAETPEAPRAYLEAALAQSAVLRPERALVYAERGAMLAREPTDVVALNMLCGKLCCESGEGKPAVEAYGNALGAAQAPEDRCRALMGIAAGQRLLAGIDAAMAALDEAEPLARANGLTRELAELHYLRGNLSFARGDLAACQTEHEAALACARLLGDAAWEANAESGLADAAYANGRMRTALARFLHCVAICDAHGLTRIAIPNRGMVGHCRIYTLEFDRAIAEIDGARKLAIEVGDRHSEMFALETLGLLMILCDRDEDAIAPLEQGLALSQAIGARRYEATLLFGLGKVAHALGQTSEARDYIERSLAISRETGMRFSGPLALGAKILMLDDPVERERCRVEAEELLAQGCISHNVIGYHRFGIEDALCRGEWSRALRQASALEAYARDEPLPYIDFFVARARALAQIAVQADARAGYDEVARLRAIARDARWPIRWPDWALRDGDATTADQG